MAIDRAFRALDAELHDARAVEIEDAQPHVRDRRHVDHRVDRAVGAAHGSEGARFRRRIGHERGEPAVLADRPVAQRDEPLGVVRLALVALDDQDTGKPASELLGRVAMRVEEESAGVRRHEFVAETIAGADRRLRQVGHAVLPVGQADAVPMDRDVLAFAGEPVLDVGLQRLAGLQPQHRQDRCRRIRSRAAAAARRSRGAPAGARRRRDRARASPPVALATRPNAAPAAKAPAPSRSCRRETATPAPCGEALTCGGTPLILSVLRASLDLQRPLAASARKRGRGDRAPAFRVTDPSRPPGCRGCRSLRARSRG